MRSDSLNKSIADDWRELGFFYDRNDLENAWVLTGSRAGLLQFRDVLLAYAADQRNALESEHEHYGPYAYLEVMTWPEAGLDEHAIRGSLTDLARLAHLIEGKIADAPPGSVVRIREEFATDSLPTLLCWSCVRMGSILHQQIPPCQLMLANRRWSRRRPGTFHSGGSGCRGSAPERWADERPFHQRHLLGATGKVYA